MSVYKRLANVFYDLDPEQREGLPEYVKWLEDALVAVSSEEEAEATLACGPLPEPIEAIAERGGFTDMDALRKNLQGAGEAGIVMMMYLDRENKIIGYYRAGLLPGLAENLATGKRITKEGAFWVDNYCKDFNMGVYPNSAPFRGGFRALPVREAIPAETKIAKYDEIEPYLEANDVFSVANCACRTSTKLLGYGCEHTEIETCIQTGSCAESFILTGRGREVSKEEVKEILKRCEREGLVHQLMPMEKGKSMFICNCCGCSCIGLQVQNLLNLQAPAHSNYEPEIDPEKCVGCGACVESCNMSALSLGCKIAAKPAVFEQIPDPMFTNWTPDLWNHDHMKRVMVNSQGTSPCKTTCPAHISVQGYIRKAAEGKYMDALKVIKRDNPFPAVCGRVCPHSCELECTRQKVDEAMAIDDIKKFIADKELEEGNRFVPEVFDHWDEKIAVIGSGPAGLTAAYYLGAKGYPVTVFEKQESLGGMMMNGIPPFRLEKDVVQAEIDILRELGVEFRTGVEVGKDVTIQQLREQGFRSFYIGIGLQNGGSLNIPGDDANGIMSGVDFMKKVNRGEDATLKGKVVVIGGGNIGADVARTAIRSGADSVDLYCLESYEDMPMGEGDRTECEEEGITIHAGWGQTEVSKDAEGNCAGISFRKCLSVKDSEGRFAPVFDDSVTETAECTTVLFCIGQRTDWGSLLEGTDVKLTARGLVEADPMTYQTADPDIFVGGDAVTGQRFVIDAIAEGKSGAISIDRYVRGRDLKIKREREYSMFDKDDADYASFEKQSRQRMAGVDHKKAVCTMKDLRADFTEEQLKKEADRCLGCGVSVLNPQRCIGCGVCFTRCEFDAIKLKKIADIEPADNVEQYMQIAGQYAMERAANLAAQGIDAGSAGIASYSHMNHGRQGE